MIKLLIKFIIVVFTMIFATSCNLSNKEGYQNSEAFGELKNELTDKFGKDAFYTNLSISNSENGAIVSTTVTQNPATLKMENWTSVDGSWNKSAEVTLEITGDKKAEDFMFKLDKVMNMNLVGKLIDDAKQKVIKEKKIEDVIVKTFSLKVPSDGDFSKTRYFIVIAPKQGGTDFNFWYHLDGTLDKFDY